MDRIIDRLHKAGIKVILGTPTYSEPPWLYHQHPEILVTYLNGQPAKYGMRQNMDTTSPAFRYYAERVIRQVIGHYKNHPAVIGYQIDNETSSDGAAGPNVQKDFVGHMKRKFGSTAEMNKAWGFVYWGQLVDSWEEMPASNGMINPDYKLKWERFEQQITPDYRGWQAKIVNQFDVSKALDMVAVNPYHDVQDQLDGWWIALCGDPSRSLKRQNYLVTETNAQTTGWDSKGQFPPYDGQLRLNAYSHVASGANMVAYGHWSSLYYGQETYWKGVLRNGGHLAMSFKSGFTDEYDTVRRSRIPGVLREAAGFSYQEFSNLKQPLALEGGPFHAGARTKCRCGPNS
jgi:beta-galactosidase